jgi:hypothetical protein
VVPWEGIEACCPAGWRRAGYSKNQRSRYNNTLSSRPAGQPATFLLTTTLSSSRSVWPPQATGATHLRRIAVVHILHGAWSRAAAPFAQRVCARIMLDQREGPDRNRASFGCERVVRCKRLFAFAISKATHRRARARRLSSSSKFLANSSPARWIFQRHRGRRREKHVEVAINQTLRDRLGKVRVHEY